MAKIVRGGQTGSLDHINSSQATFRAQISALTDAVRQLGGNAEIGSGAVTNDPLNAPYVLYVNPYTGTDTFVGGNYSTSGSATQRIELQRLECGYSEARPFKTINRAIIEAGIITAKSFYESPLTNNDLVSIVLAPGVYTIYNGTGAASVSEWAATKSPTTDELTEFNTNTTGGVILPRGVSLCGLDLRKTIFRPHSLPSVADEAADASNRRAIFKVTGTGYYFGFTFMDKVGSTSSHHLLHAFEFASQSELDEFYTKIRQAFGGTNNTGGLSNALAVTKTAEYEIVGPQPTPGSQTINTDTTLSASPYIFNCSIRSNYGLCGVYADGAKTSGFRSLVIAQFTGVSLQRDLNCWQKYDNGQDTKWSSTYFTNYADYISTPPNNVRMDPARRSFHIRAVNNAVIQEVSVFAIGQGIHHWTQSGGEITITNSNSNFGGCAAVSEGYRTVSAAADTNWNVSKIRVATNLTDKANNVQRIYLGTISAVTSSTITLTTALGDSATVPGVPDIVASKGYTLRNASRVWVENPLGKDWSSTFTSSAWSSSSATVLNISAALQNEDSEAPAVVNSVSSAVGKRAYIRRLVDTRSPDERRFTIKLNNTAQGSRLPVRDYVLQTDTDGASISSSIGSSNLILVANAAKLPTTGQGVYTCSEVVLRRGNPSVTWTSNASYKKGDTVKRNGKHYTCLKDNADTNFDASKWDESYVHMPSDYNPEDFYKNEAPIITFDNDTASTENSTTLGYTLSTVWTSDSLISAQYRAGTDYRGLHLFLTALGFTSDQAHTILAPKAPASRERDPSSSTDMGGYIPSGAANALANWPIEFRRPSVIRLFGHAWEWAGYLNYTKAIPAYQGDLSPQNKFTSYFTNVNGGRVYATGFNEEGFQVTPRGLEDVATGTQLSVESLGSSDLTLATPTEFTNLTLRGATDINGTLDLTDVNDLRLPSTINATTETPGIGEIASIADIENSSLVTTDSGLNGAGGKFVTAAGLKYWASWARVLTQRSGAAVFYVVPDNAVLGGTYNFDGTSATLTADPTRSGSAISTDPPTSRAKAVRFSRAVEYANANYSTLETVNYYLANGPYWTSVVFQTIANVYGATSQFAQDTTISDFTQATTSPAGVNVLNIQNNKSAPVFATPIYVNESDNITPKRIAFYASPAYLNFMFGGSVQGVVWATSSRTLADSDFPDSLFGNLAVTRPAASSSIQSLIQTYVNNNSSYDSSWQIDHFATTATIYVNSNSLAIYDCVFGAKASGYSGIGYGNIGAIVMLTGKADLAMAGIYLLGNTLLTSLTFNANKPTLSSSGAQIYGCRNSQCLVGSREESAIARDCSIIFPHRNIINFAPVGGTYDLNTNGNCIHVLDNNGNYGLMANRTATNGSRGATFDFILGPMAPGSRIYTGGYTSYQSGWANPNKHHGFAGVFGDLRGPSETGWGPIGISGDLAPLSFYRFASYHGSLWQQANTGSRLTSNTSLTYSPGGRVEAYTSSANNPLNIRSSVFFRGIDTDSAQVVGGSLEPLVVSGTTRYVFYG